MKKRKISILLIIAIVVLAPFLAFEILLGGGIDAYDGGYPDKCNENYPSAIRTVIWYGLGESGKIEVIPVTSLNVFLWSLKKDSEGNRIIWPPGSKLTSFIAQRHLEGNKMNMSSWHYVNACLAIWLSKKWSTEDTLNSVAERLYFGKGVHGFKNAAEYFYRKKTDALNNDEIAELLALSYYPNEKRNSEPVKMKKTRILEQITKGESNQLYSQ